MSVRKWILIPVIASTALDAVALVMTAQEMQAGNPANPITTVAVAGSLIANVLVISDAFGGKSSSTAQEQPTLQPAATEAPAEPSPAEQSSTIAMEPVSPEKNGRADSTEPVKAPTGPVALFDQPQPVSQSVPHTLDNLAADSKLDAVMADRAKSEYGYTAATPKQPPVMTLEDLADQAQPESGPTGPAFESMYNAEEQARRQEQEDREDFSVMLQGMHADDLFDDISDEQEQAASSNPVAMSSDETAAAEEQRAKDMAMFAALANKPTSEPESVDVAPEAPVDHEENKGTDTVPESDAETEPCIGVEYNSMTEPTCDVAEEETAGAEHDEALEPNADTEEGTDSENDDEGDLEDDTEGESPDTEDGDEDDLEDDAEEDDPDTEDGDEDDLMDETEEDDSDAEDAEEDNLEDEAEEDDSDAEDGDEDDLVDETEEDDSDTEDAEEDNLVNDVKEEDLVADAEGDEAITPEPEVQAEDSSDDEETMETVPAADTEEKNTAGTEDGKGIEAAAAIGVGAVTDAGTNETAEPDIDTEEEETADTDAEADMVSSSDIMILNPVPSYGKELNGFEKAIETVLRRANIVPQDLYVIEGYKEGAVCLTRDAAHYFVYVCENGKAKDIACYRVTDQEREAGKDFVSRIHKAME